MSVEAIENDLLNLGCHHYSASYVAPRVSSDSFEFTDYLAALTHVIGSPWQHELQGPNHNPKTTFGKFATHLADLGVETVLAQKEKHKLFHPDDSIRRPWLKWQIACVAAEATLQLSLKDEAVKSPGMPSPVVLTDKGEIVAVIKSAGNPLVLGLANREEFGIFRGCFSVPSGLTTDFDSKKVNHEHAHQLPLRQLGKTALIRMSSFLIPPKDRPAAGTNTSKATTTVDSIAAQVGTMELTPLSDAHYDMMTDPYL